MATLRRGDPIGAVELRRYQPRPGGIAFLGIIIAAIAVLVAIQAVKAVLVEPRKGRHEKEKRMGTVKKFVVSAVDVTTAVATGVVSSVLVAPGRG
jgi:NADH:ubiquinone oxidoreductase subunit 2 (subunit N)